MEASRLKLLHHHLLRQKLSQRLLRLKRLHRGRPTAVEASGLKRLYRDRLTAVEASRLKRLM